MEFVHAMAGDGAKPTVALTFIDDPVKIKR